MMDSVYLETTFVSYLVALPARDLVVAAHQQITRDWWEHRRHQFRCVISPFVMDEISAGDPSEIKKRQEFVEPLEILAISLEVETLARAIMAARVLPEKAIGDATHIAVAAIHGIQYMATWNCKHLANPQIARRVGRICDALGITMPMICTPEELFEVERHD